MIRNTAEILQILTPSGERKHEQIETIIVGEELTVCYHCGARTKLEGFWIENYRRESCLHCEQRYDVEDEDETDGFGDELGDVSDVPENPLSGSF